jgi:hypothetical protein
MAKRTSPGAVPADPAKWSASSQRSVSAEWTTEYTPFRYSCWRCRASAVFSAEDQRYTYEVKRANINQQRLLCEPCWSRLNVISKDLAEHQSRWSEAKASLAKDRAFLERWLKLLSEKEEYVPYRADTAKKNMLTKLLRAA